MNYDGLTCADWETFERIHGAAAAWLRARSIEREHGLLKRRQEHQTLNRWETERLAELDGHFQWLHTLATDTRPQGG